MYIYVIYVVYMLYVICTYAPGASAASLLRCASRYPPLDGGTGPVSDMAVASGPSSCHTARGFSRSSDPPVNVKISTGHTHTHTDREQHPRHRHTHKHTHTHTHTHDKKNTPNPKRTPPTNTYQRSGPPVYVKRRFELKVPCSYS